MTFILRWPAILVLLLLVFASFGAAFAGVVHLAELPIALPMTAEQEATVAQLSWIEVGLWAGAGLFFLIAAVRLIRRTQAFWTWLIGFAFYGAPLGDRAAEREPAASSPIVQSIDVNAYRCARRARGQHRRHRSASRPARHHSSSSALIIFIVDAVDRAYWDKQGA
jgi:hypothetical protein